jgi:hypothetical protein
MIEAGELSYITSYQTLSANKQNWKSYKASMKLVKKLGANLHP